jgi:hypothetical protein
MKFFVIIMMSVGSIIVFNNISAIELLCFLIPLYPVCSLVITAPCLKIIGDFVMGRWFTAGKGRTYQKQTINEKQMFSVILTHRGRFDKTNVGNI